MKKTIAVLLAVMMIVTSVSVFAVNAETADKGAPTAFQTYAALYVHAVTGSTDGDAWQAWQSAHDEDFYEDNSSLKYFFLPASADDECVDIYNAFSSDVAVNGVTIAAGSTASVPYCVGENYSVVAEGKSYTLKYLKSNAEAAIYINNSDADGYGTELMTYLAPDKSRKATATGAIVTPDGAVNNTPIKKIKGRGNTTWQKPKKGYNITYDKKVSIAGMTKSKKYSILANYQDDSLSRNRFLYDLSDAVGMPYASDSRYVDFYSNGYYWGSYQMCEKVEAGDLVYDVDEDDYLDENGNLKEDFSFIAEVDASAGADDYYVQLSNGVKITMKSPEIEPGAVGYDEVKAYVKEKFEAFAAEAKKKNGKVSDYADLDSVTKLMLINELGKNWDSGVSSTFFTYKPDENGNYKFYGSPVWDYDNSLGNAIGVSGELNNIGVTDYTSYTGWWCKYKGKSASGRANGGNIINSLANNTEVMDAAARIWFEDFVPAIEHFAGKQYNGVIEKELYTADEYYALIKDSADMNYTSGWLLNTSSWIAPHTSLTRAEFNYDTMTYSVKTRANRYTNTFEGMYKFTVDWMTSRAAWLSSEFAQSYTPAKVTVGDVNLDGTVDITDATYVQKYAAAMVDLNAKQFEAADIDFNGTVNIVDATSIQKIVAGYELNFSKPSPEPDDAEEDESGYRVIFTNSLHWSGDIYCYYWGGGYQPYDWPGEAMEYLGTNEYGEDYYAVVVPKEAEYVIFSNNTNVQTANIPFDGTKLGFYALETYVEMNNSLRYNYGTFDTTVVV